MTWKKRGKGKKKTKKKLVETLDSHLALVARN
jgi:hypothetical protein